MRQLRSLTLLFAVWLCLSCLASIAHGSPRIPPPRRSSSALSDEIKRLKQAGIPTTPGELQAPMPPADRNAAPLYLKLDALLKAKLLIGDDAKAAAFTGRRVPNALQARQIRALLQNRKDIDALVQAIVSKPECVFDRNWSQVGAVPFPELARMRFVVRWLSARSALQLYDGKPLQAVATMALGFRVSRHATRDPILVAFLVGVAIEAITQYGLERILYADGGKPGVAEAVKHAFEAASDVPSLAHGLTGEILIALIDLNRARSAGPVTFEKMVRDLQQSGDVGMIPVLAPVDRKDWDGFIDRSEVVMLRGLRTLVVAADKPYPQARAIFRTVNSDLDVHRNNAAYAFAGTVFPIADPEIEIQARTHAGRTTVEAATALFAWKALHKTFPTTLNAAMRTVPTDPFDGKPIRYTRIGDGFVVYSIGPTGKFDGGTPAVKPDPMESFVRYPLPAYVK